MTEQPPRRPPFDISGYPTPATTSELIAAIHGYRQHLDTFAMGVSEDLRWFAEKLEARLAILEANKKPS